jgi:transcriptional regulatory protein RtcR
MGSDKETQIDFQLIAGTNRDLKNDARAGRFRDDLLARINHWTFSLPALRDRPEDIEPNIDYELDRHTQHASCTVRFNAEARRAFIRFATSPEALWTGNFRQLSAAITRMATLADGGRITEQLVMDEIARLKANWVEPSSDFLTSLLPTATLEELDAFDRLQLESVVAVCRRSRSLADAGRALFGASRSRRRTINDSDRLRKYLARFGLKWAELVGREEQFDEEI